MIFNKKISAICLSAVVLGSSILTGAHLVESKNISLEVEGKNKQLLTYSSKVKDIIEVEKIKLENGDLVKPELEEEIINGMKIKVLKGEKYKIIEGKDRGEIKGAGENIKEILETAGVELGDNDYTIPALDEKPGEDKVIDLHRVTVEHVEKNVDVNFDIEEVPNKDMYQGEKKVIKPGVKGSKRETIQNLYDNGKLVNTTVLNSKLEKEPVTQVQEVGTKEGKTINGKRYTKVITMQGTAYDPTAGSKTAMGTRARVGAVAVDPKVIPLGTKLYIESMDSFPTYGFAVAEDTGGAIKGNRIDLFYNTNAQANRFGRRNVKVYVLAE